MQSLAYCCGIAELCCELKAVLPGIQKFMLCFVDLLPVFHILSLNGLSGHIIWAPSPSGVIMLRNMEAPIMTAQRLFLHFLFFGCCLP